MPEVLEVEVEGAGGGESAPLSTLEAEGSGEASDGCRAVEAARGCKVMYVCQGM